ncbi:dynamin-related protein [Salix suchowensis]|nr:dynamin-related protein [Salix suchowensis]
MSVALKHGGSVSEEERWSSSENQAESLEEKHQEVVVSHVPIVSSFNDRIRPLLDAVDKLRHLQEARKVEADLFETNSLLSKIDKSMVGIPVLAQKLVHIQATIIARCLPEIVRKINEKLNGSIKDLKRMPKTLSTVGEALTTFMGIVGSAKESLNKIIISKY